jgi:DNA-3-methyladenine glycosylase II
MKLTLNPAPPFDFDLSARIFSKDDKQIRRYEDGKYWQVIRVNDKLILSTMSTLGTVDKPRLLVELEPNEEISDEDEKTARETVSSLFNMNMDLKSFCEEVGNDRIMSGLTRKLRGLRSPTAETVFEALISSITEQQISLNVALNIQRRIIKAFGDTLEIQGKRYYAFPTPQKLASSTTEELRNCGLSLRKAEYIHGASELVASKKLDLDKFKNYDDTKEIIDELCEIRGIGVWTAELTIIRGMQKFEAIPADDIGLQRHVSHYYFGGRKISSQELRMIAEKWGKWKGLAGFYLIVAESLNIEA